MMSFSRREALVITEQKKRECDTKALRIVENMLDDCVQPDWLLDNLKYISQSHFQDVIEERAISKQCGYPLCKKLLGNIPNQQFHISVKTNKVYDITERKHFCSNGCYKASQFLKEQLLTSPVWLRESETIPSFKLLHPSSPGGFGKEVEFDYNAKATEEPKAFEVSKTAELGGEVQVSSPPLSSEDPCVHHFHEKSCCEKDPSSHKMNAGTKHGCEVFCDLSRENLKASDEAPKKLSNHKDQCDKPLRRKTKVGKNSEKAPNYINFVGRIEKCFSEWFTVDSLIFICGNDRAKEILKDRVNCLKSDQHLTKSHMDPVIERRYANLCKKLNLLELEDTFESAKLLEKESKPLPDIEQLREDAKIMEIKVREFYRGSTRVSFKEEKTNDDNDGCDSSGIPLVDAHAQNALRRRIILDRLRHILPDILRTLGMTSSDINEDVNGLFMTFSLKADNIMFKPAEWNLIGLIILKMLSLRNSKLKTLMETKLSQKYCSMMLMAFQLDYGYLDRLIASLCEADILINAVK